MEPPIETITSDRLNIRLYKDKVHMNELSLICKTQTDKTFNIRDFAIPQSYISIEGLKPLVVVTIITLVRHKDNITLISKTTSDKYFSILQYVKIKNFVNRLEYLKKNFKHIELKE